LFKYWCYGIVIVIKQLRAHQRAVARRLQDDAAPLLNGEGGGGNAGGWGVPMNE
jgi:hypothetical protein